MNKTTRRQILGFSTLTYYNQLLRCRNVISEDEYLKISQLIRIKYSIPPHGA